ncbi:WG repeat-containing protein [Candidatus Hydrogenedentota bacterium]
MFDVVMFSILALTALAVVIFSLIILATVVRLCVKHRRRKSVQIAALLFVASCIAGVLYLNRWPKQFETTPQAATAEWLYPAKEGRKWGYINEEGKWAIPPQFSYASRFHNGRAIVSILHRIVVTSQPSFLPTVDHGIMIDRSGRVMTDRRTVVRGSLRDGMARAWSCRSFGILSWNSGKQGYVDEEGIWVIKPSSYFSGNFSEGLGMANISYGDPFGYIDTTGEWVIPPQFRSASRFSEGLANVCRGEEWGFTDRDGEFTTLPTGVYSTGDLSEGLASACYERLDCNGKTIYCVGFITREGEWAFQLDDCHSPSSDGHLFSEGLAVVVTNGEKRLWGYVNTKGEWHIPASYEYAEPFSEGLAAVKLDGKWMYIDSEGNKVIDAQEFHNAGSFEGPLAPVDSIIDWGCKDELIRIGAYINRFGEVVWKCTY